MKHLLVILILGLSLTMNAQDGFKLGGGLSYAAKAQHIGLQLKAEKGFSERYNGELSVTYFLVSGTTSVGVDANLHMKGLEIRESFRLNPLAGLNFAYSNTEVNEVSTSDTLIGINIGAEASFPVSGMNFYLQPKYVIGGVKGFVFSTGLFF